MGSSYARHAARGALAGVFIFLWLFASPQRRALADEGKKAQAQKPFVFSASLTNGKKAGPLVLGQTTFEEVLKIFPQPPFEDYDGALRLLENPQSESMQSIEYVYNPWQTMYALFFDADMRLVMVSELYELGRLTEKELLRRYPNMVKTDSEQGSIEYQAEIFDCAAVIATVETAGHTVEQLSYAYTCE